MNRAEGCLVYLALACVFVWLAIVTVAIYYTAHLHFENRKAEQELRAQKEAQAMAAPYGRPIPRCDKELWLRIKDGCNVKP